jgi:uncharacterized protein (DUF1778 family)
LVVAGLDLSNPATQKGAALGIGLILVIGLIVYAIRKKIRTRNRRMTIEMGAQMIHELPMKSTDGKTTQLTVPNDSKSIEEEAGLILEAIAISSATIEDFRDSGVSRRSRFIADLTNWNELASYLLKTYMDALTKEQEEKRLFEEKVRSDDLKLAKEAFNKLIEAKDNPFEHKATIVSIHDNRFNIAYSEISAGTGVTLHDATEEALQQLDTLVKDAVIKQAKDMISDVQQSWLGMNPENLKDRLESIQRHLNPTGVKLDTLLAYEILGEMAMKAMGFSDKFGTKGSDPAQS